MTNGTAIAGRNDKVITTDIDTCKLLCANETSFECLSFDYITSTNECKLSSAKRGQPDVEMVYQWDYLYFEKQNSVINETKIKNSTEKTPSFRLPAGISFNLTNGTAIAGRNDKVITTDIQTCKLLCANESDFDCLSFDYITSTNECKLSSAKRG